VLPCLERLILTIGLRTPLSVPIRVPVDHHAARTRHPDAVALDAAVEIAAVLVLLEEGVARVEERHARESSWSYVATVETREAGHVGQRVRNDRGVEAS